jgi:hypothetical protein
MPTIYKLFSFLLLFSLLAVQGCVPVAIGYMAHKLSEAKTESAEKAQRSADLRTYTTYRTDMERINLDREKAGFKPRPIMTQEEWISAQTAGRPAIAPASTPVTPAPTPTPVAVNQESASK